MGNKTINQLTSIEDLAQDPKAYGLPTFAEFQKNKKKWTPGSNPERGMIALTDGPRTDREGLKNIITQVNGESMPHERVERVLSDYGYTGKDINLLKETRLKKTIRKIQLGGGYYDMVVNFLPEIAGSEKAD